MNGAKKNVGRGTNRTCTSHITLLAVRQSSPAVSHSAAVCYQLGAAVAVVV